MSDKTDEGSQQASPNQARGLNRRAVLTGATAVVPTILTLGSGAALARSSNLIGTVKKSPGDVLCLDPQSTNGPSMQNPNLYDLGSPPYGEVTRIPVAHKYRRKSNGDGMSPGEVCRFDGKVEVKYNGSGPWRERSRRAGVLVSNAAVASFGDRIIKTDI
jgi:hypothetical protein